MSRAFLPTEVIVRSEGDRAALMALVKDAPLPLAVRVRAARSVPLLERLLSQIEPDTNGGCWLWTGMLNPQGYGLLSVNSRMEGVHRISHRLFVGPVPDYDKANPIVVRHRCDVRCCLNPAHLELGTQLENIADRHRRGRTRTDMNRKGSAHPLAKLSEHSVRAIRAAAATGERQKDIARRFGVTQTNVSHIITRSSWGHLE